MSSSFNDVFKFKVSVPSDLLGNVETEPPRCHYESSNLGFRPLAGNPLSVNSIWTGPSDRRFGTNGTRSEMPPPRAPARIPFQRTFVDESVNPFANRMLHSTPVHSLYGKNKPQSSFRPQTESTLGASNWSAVGSTYRGSESVRSIGSSNTNFIDKLLQRGLNKFLAKGRINPEYEELAIQVANGLKFCVQEAALELAPDEGSVRSHFSKHAATWRSGMSTISGRSQNSLKSLHKLRQGTPSIRKNISPVKSIDCTKERVNKRPYGRITEEPAPDSQFLTNFSVLEKSILPSKLCLTPDDNENECSEPQTVRRRLSNDDQVTSTAVLAFESPTSTGGNNVIRTSPKGKRAKPTLIDALAGRTGILTHDDDDDFKPTSAASKKKTAPKKTKAKAPPQKAETKPKNNKKSDSSVRISAIAIVTISTTRSGRNVKKPSFYQVPGKTKSRKKESAANGEKDKSCNDKSDVSVGSKAVPKVPRKPVVKKAAVTPVVVAEPAPVIITKRGRAVKPTEMYGAIKQMTPSPAVNQPTQSKSRTATKKVSPKKTKTVKPTKAKNEKSRTGVTPKSHPEIDLDDDLSMSGIDFYIPEVTQSTRRGAKRKNATEKLLAAQTPPLTHFVANLHSGIIASASHTGKTTPDWQPSQRTESEARELQKRKLGPRKKKPVKAPVKKVRPVRNTPINLKFLKLARQSIADKMNSLNNSDNSSDESETE